MKSSIKDFSVNMTKFAVSRGYGQFTEKILNGKLYFFVQCVLLFSSINIFTFSNVNTYLEFSEILRKVQKPLKKYLVRVNKDNRRMSLDIGLVSSMLTLTHLFPMHPLCTPREHLMFSGVRERV